MSDSHSIDREQSSVQVVGDQVATFVQSGGSFGAVDLLLDGGAQPAATPVHELTLPATPRLRRLELRRLPALRVLELDAPRLHYLVVQGQTRLEKVGGLPGLKELQAHVPLQVFDGSLAKVMAVHDTVVDEASVATLAQLERATFLSLTTPLRDLQFLPPLPRIRALFVRGPNLRSLAGIVRLAGLKKLTAKGPCLEDISALEALPGLTDITFADCGALADISALKAVVRLRLLDLSRTRVRAQGIPLSLIPDRSPNPIFPASLGKRAQALKRTGR